MLRTLCVALLCAGLAVSSFATGSVSAEDKEKFARERKPSNQAAKDALEGKAPPKLMVKNWMNSKPLSLEKLSGKVVVIDFWGTW